MFDKSIGLMRHPRLRQKGFLEDRRNRSEMLVRYGLKWFRFVSILAVGT